ncbi:NAD(P)-dependent oxidoreductase [Mycobacterium sp.]|uniref:NAD(P)-dependent oxidoreductase n=1 Tax=Mycobacterium sp. TaxID=1785 RepID=UPI002DA91B33|nr:NAD(P)-dependent oxidoreductase [Mycobacterium sp.]
MDIGFVGLGNMGAPIATRLVAAGHRVVVFDVAPTAVDKLVHRGASPAASVRELADQVDTVMASLPTPPVSMHVAAEVAQGGRARRFVDLSTVGSQAAQHNHALLAERNIAALDSPVSGGVRGAEAGALSVMVSGPRAEFDALAPAFEAIGHAIFVSELPGAAQTMKLVNNLMAATALAATAEVMVMGVKAGLDAQVMIDVLNAGSGATDASRNKFPKAVLPRTFDYGFATGLMTKDVRLFLEEAEALGLSVELAQAVARVWEKTLREEGPESDFTSIVKPMESSAGVIVGEERR